MEIITCKNCGTEKQVHKSRNQRFCSRGCAASFRQKAHDLSIFGEGLTKLNAYIMGWIFSDGCLSFNQKDSSYRITIGSKDREVIAWMHDLMTPDRKIYEQTKKGKTYYSIVTTNKTDIKFLRSKGLVERKSRIITYPDVPDNLQLPFIRGYFDGNGCAYESTIVSNGKEYKYVYASFTSGSEVFLVSLQDVLSDVGVYSRVRPDSRLDNNSYGLHIQRKAHVARFAKWLYSDPGMKLKRKYKVFADNDIV